MKRINITLIAFVLIFYFSSNNSFSQWIQTSGPNGVGEVFALAVSDNNIFAGTHYGGVYISTDNGGSWEQRNNGFTNLWITAIAISGENVFAGTRIDGVFKSTDNGLNWTRVHYIGDYINSLYVTGNNIFEGTVYYNPNYPNKEGGVYRSTDEGTSWVKLNEGIPYLPDIKDFVFNGNYLFTVSYNNGAFRSNDYGANWELINNGLPINYQQAIKLIANDSIVFIGTKGKGIFRSTNNGLFWIAVNDGLPTDAVIGALATVGDNIFAGTAESPNWTPQGIYQSTNNGENWTAINTGLPPTTDIRSIAIKDGFIFIGTANAGGVWFRPLSELITDVEGEVSQIPKEYKLEQNFPNPFNPTTTISFSIPQGQNIELNIYDILGKKVDNLVNTYETAGKHSVTFNATSLSSGVYFYELKAGEFIETKKMIFMK